VTRRKLLQVGGLTGAAVLVGVRPWAPARASAANAVPDYLVRSSYLDLANPDFAISGGGTARLRGVSDLIGGKNLIGSEDAFALSFECSRALPQGTVTLTHPELGRFDLFVAPGAGTDINVVVNRSVGASRPSGPTPERKRAASVTTTPKPPPHAKRHEVIKKLALRRSRRGLVCDVRINPDAHVEAVAVWLMRGDRVVAVASRETHKHHTRLRLRTKRRARRGAYTLAVVVSGPKAVQHGRRKTVALR
jgi:hypothetical protein